MSCFVYYLARQDVNGIALANDEQVHIFLFYLFFLQVNSFRVLPKMHTFKVIVFCSRYRIRTVFSIYFDFIEHLSPCLRFQDESYLREILSFLQFEMVELAFLLCEHKLYVISRI